ncbi:MAG TPA: TolC family protein [Gemmatimonadota bacterium]|nr:TolC family protein [Gemmatimonadota bacterium]
MLLASPLFAQEPLPEAPRITLAQAIESALARNPALAQADAQRDATAADRLGALGAFLPSVNMTYGYQNSSTGRLDPTGAAITQESHAFLFSGSYDLFTGWQRTSDLKAASLRLEAEEAGFAEQRYATVLAVKEAYYAALAARDLYEVEADRVERQVDQLEFVERQVELGRATLSDQLRSKVDLNNARVALLGASNAILQTRLVLSEAIGLDEVVAPTEEDTLAMAPLSITREQALTMAEETSPGVEAAEAFAEAAQAAVTSARSSYWPTLSLGASQAWRSEAFPPEDESWSMSLTARYPLFNGLGREATLRRARAQEDGARAGARAAVLATRTSVGAAYDQVDLARASVELAVETVALAREDLRVTEERYRVGLATILDLQTSQIALLQAEVDLIRRRFDHAIGIARLEAQLGRSLP